MKNLFILFIIFFSSGCLGQSLNFSSQVKISHTYGDESYSFEELHFEITKGKVYGSILEPDTNQLLSSKTLLNNSDIGILNAFLGLVEKYSNNCYEEFTSSNVQHYTVEIDAQTIEIRKFCDWENYKFFDLKNSIFKKYLTELEVKKKELNDEFSKLLIGKWKEDYLIDKLPIDSVGTLKKITKTPFGDRTYLEFGRNQKAVIYRDKKKTYYTYRIDKLSSKVYLWLVGVNEKNAKEFVYSHRYSIISLENGEMKLIRS